MNSPSETDGKPVSQADINAACSHLRKMMFHRLKAWDELSLAEKLLGQDIDSSSSELDCFLAQFYEPSEVHGLSDDEVLAAVGLGDCQGKFYE
jgi:hypothetical protein